MSKGSTKRSFQAPLMSAFREAFEARDAKDVQVRIVDGEKVIEGRQSRQRRGDEVALKRDLAVDLLALVNTINLNSTLDLQEASYVRKSVLNYGLPDISHMTSLDASVEQIRDQLITALKTYEPRILPETLIVDKEIVKDDVNQRVRFAVSCEMFCTPVDVAMDFVAELEVSSGKINLSRLPVTG
jgi:type VI secretion system protein ImpF